MEETKLPDKKYFFNQLTQQHITDDEYAYANEIWKHFHCKKISDYLKIYLIVDILLLACSWNKFGQMTEKLYGLCVNHYISAPGLSFDAMLRHTRVKLELLHDPEIIMFFVEMIRGGIFDSFVSFSFLSLIFSGVCQANVHYVEANNKYMRNFDPSKQSNFLMDFDFVRKRNEIFKNIVKF